jgi:hypothetical protein
MSKEFRALSLVRSQWTYQNSAALVLSIADWNDTLADDSSVAIDDIGPWNNNVKFSK